MDLLLRWKLAPNHRPTGVPGAAWAGAGAAALTTSELEDEVASSLRGRWRVGGWGGCSCRVAGGRSSRS
eukprot:8847502-Prorocentrum_lima.AAC.1